MSTQQAKPIQFKAVSPQFHVPDVVRAAEYYRDILGFAILSYWDGRRASAATDPPPVFTIVSRGDVQVFFSRAKRFVRRGPDPDGGYDAFFSVTGVDALAREFRSRGADIIDGPEDRPYLQREVVVRDCNGFILAFGEADISSSAIHTQREGR